MIKSLCTFLLGTSFFASVAFGVSADDQDLVAQIQNLAVQLKATASKEAGCRIADMPSCSFQSSCRQFDGKGRNFYLYENEEGRQIPNFAFTSAISDAQECLGGFRELDEVNDPFVYPERLYDPEMAGGHEKIKQNFSRFQKEGNRVRSIFSDVQNRVLAFLKSRRTSQNAAEIDNMINRISKIKLEVPTAGTRIADLATMGCEVPNAFYNPSSHQVTVCPQVMNMPDATLFSAITHELGHSVDPCQAQKSYSTYSGVRSADELLDQASPNATFKKISIAKNPFKSVISCLQGPSSLNVKLPSKDALVAKAKKDQQESLELKQDRDEGDNQDSYSDKTEADFEDKLQSIEDNYDKMKYCYSESGDGKIQESFSDWISSQALKQKISEIQDSGKARQYAFESQAIFMARSCKNVQQTAVAYIRPIVKDRCYDLERKFEFADRSDDVSDSHPSTAGRVNRILYAPPEIQKALGCKNTDPVLTECK
ncbi:hypothetical protein [Bdellovibrio sp. HCB2-146]|uniref:hypothetical protein n=1 Tax=Bdellovibrio sp. HCB2-146 TaxID=3394362 RepID=UPI0039BC452F